MIHMQQSFNEQEIEILKTLEYCTGDYKTILQMPSIMPQQPFCESIVSFLSDLSTELLRLKEAKEYSDVITFAFWIRKASLIQLKAKNYVEEGKRTCLGRGVAFHIAPSNVPVNYAYSLVAGLLTGNANIVRIPSKKFQQVEIINRTICDVLHNHNEVTPYIALVRYGHQQDVNDIFSRICNTRIIWGGDATISEVRKSPIGSRTTEITFADRYSIAVIDSDAYLDIQDKKRIAEDFYNDTYLTDQNACTSPKVIVWTGHNKEKAKSIFWECLHDIVESRYTFQNIQGIDKLTTTCLAATAYDNLQVIPSTDNLIIRIKVLKCLPELMNYNGNSGYFYELDCDDILELKDLCDCIKCQTVSYIGDNKMFEPLLLSGSHGIDRIVPVGKTMDFELVWDGYKLVEMLTRTICIS